MLIGTSTYRHSRYSRQRCSKVCCGSDSPARDVSTFYGIKKHVLTCHVDPWTARKSPFPPVLKQDVRAAGKVCIENEMLSERDDERRQGLFTALCSCLPYNATTLRVSRPYSERIRPRADWRRNCFIDCVNRIIGTSCSIAKIPVLNA